MANTLKIKVNVIVAVLLLALSLSLVNGDDSDASKGRIVVHTPLQNYEQPSLRDYEECHENRDNCMAICAGKPKCESECPLCPELTDEPLLVQGVNDTLYVAPAQPALNTTNIIRLTNQINNVIQNDIQARNEVNVKVHQNVSQVGGRFGLGYNEQGSCCYVVRRDRSCDEENKEHKALCQEHSRQRVCGERCQARVMIAKRIVMCKKDQSDDCHESVEYVPRRHRSRQENQQQQQSSPCRYMNNWPYVNCGGQDRGGRRLRRGTCQRCLQLPYGYILQNGLQAECVGCFQGYASSMMPAPIFYSPFAPMPNFGYNYMPQPESQHHDKEQEPSSDMDDGGVNDGWVLETENCVDANGQLVNCPKDENAAAPGNKQPEYLEQGDSLDTDSLDTDDSGYDVPIQRRRRRRHHHNPNN
ncbi:uncharacterized protein LOC6568306 [Drosophila grimshawi]|uniref:GH17384 n=1 Tax=Drosophila grimshawi TaxID=7222 RepID=B4JV19_DROGR|nr:uncharacterized protein LOC6568306 [Drosophila grimshawi]EDV91339.1 GH17384 [Drosophila grimshawi]